MAWGELLIQQQGEEPLPGFSRTPPGGLCTCPAFSCPIGLGMVPRTISMHLSLEANILKAPEDREGLRPLLRHIPSPSSSTHKVCFPKEAPGSSPGSWPTILGG